MSKQGIELQFNWIFILIAGAIILAFFFSVVQKQRALNEERLSLTLSAQMDAVFAGAIESKGTTQANLAVPRSGITFSCTSFCTCKYYIGKATTDFGDKLLFAPASIKGQNAIASAVEWKFPFRIANFLVLTSPAIKYFIIYDSSNQPSVQLFRHVNKILPREISQQTFSSVSAAYEVAPEGYDHTRFVFLGTTEPDLGRLNPQFMEEDVSGVWIDQDFSKVIFYEKTSEGTLDFSRYPSLLAGDATALAAVFAADHDMYNCVMRNAFDKLSIVAAVQAARAKALKTAMEVEDRVGCSSAYAAITRELDDIALKATILKKSFPEGKTPDEAEALRSLISVQSRLQQQNKDLLISSCPELY
ncbi:MAG: hypothetical protein QXT19_00850 [Candidatus Woesearchaeota archaeon]